jgi:hypothetical protein
MINEISVIEEEGYPTFLIVRSDRSILVVNSDLSGVNEWSFREELGTCNGMYVVEYGNEEEMDFEVGGVGVGGDAIERMRKRFQV